MDLTLTRSLFRPDGIFSAWADANGQRLCVSVTHAYSDGAGGWKPKIPPGRYRCVRGKHRLHGMEHDFETFEITGVPGHTNILIHWGNFNDDSEGCECVGEVIADGIHHGQHCDMVTNSKATFATFMALQGGLDEFWLTVREAV